MGGGHAMSKLPHVLRPSWLVCHCPESPALVDDAPRGGVAHCWGAAASHVPHHQGRLTCSLLCTAPGTRAPWSVKLVVRLMCAGFIDADEFIILHDEMWLPGVLEEYTQYGGLVLYWKLFGSSGHVQRPAEGVLRSYTKCSLAPPEIRSNLKTIARTDACKEVVIVHQCKYRKDGSVPPFAGKRLSELLKLRGGSHRTAEEC